MSLPRASPWLATIVLLVAAGAACAAPRRVPLARDLVGTDEVFRDAAGDAVAAEPQQQFDPDAGYRADFYAARGLYVQGRGHWSTLGDDFDGDTTLVGIFDNIQVPDVDDGTGYELGIGWLSEGWGMELTYSRIDYDGSIPGGDADVEHEAITWNMMRYLRGNEPLQPYFLFGFVFPWAELENASLGQDAELENGFGMDFGLGLASWIGPNVALDLRALYTFEWFDEAEGAVSSGEIDDPVYGQSFGLSLGLTFVVPRGDG